MKIAIVGAGKLGVKITEALASGDNQVTLIDQNPKILQKVNSQLDVLTLNANGVQLDTYEEIDIETYDYLVAVTNNDEKNIVICAFAKKMGCTKVIARVRDPEYVNQLDFIKKAMDIDYIVNPDRLISDEIYKYLLHRYKSCNEFFTGVTIGMLEFGAEALPIIINKKVGDAITIIENVLIVSISRNGNIIIPKSNTVILEDDILYVMGKRDMLAKLANIVQANDLQHGVKRVMIIGGGKTGFYLAQLLSEAGIAVKIVETDRERCRYLAQNLNDVLVLHGDGTDINLLEDENISGMDALVTATGFDEDNLLLALMAKQYGVEEVVAKVSRRNYSDLVDRLGINATLNTLDITSSSILRFVQGAKLVNASFFLQGQAEIMEINVNKKMKITGKKIANMDLPAGVMIGLVWHGNEAIIPNGSTEIFDGDRIIVFCMLSDVSALERLLQTGKEGFFH